MFTARYGLIPYIKQEEAIACPMAAGDSRPIAEQASTIHLPFLSFTVIFLNSKANARVFDAKSGHGPHPFPQAGRLHVGA